MKNKFYFIPTAATLSLVCIDATAAISSGCSTSHSCLSNCSILVGSASNCTSSTTTYYSDGGFDGEEYGGVISCTMCKSGATITRATFQIATNCTASYYYCACSCSTTGWTAGNTGYEKRTVCNTTTCATSTEYRCAVGYYGASTNGTSGCSRCPASGGVYGTTASAGSTSITACYIPSGSAFSDGTGAGTYTGNCFYKN